MNTSNIIDSTVIEIDSTAIVIPITYMQMVHRSIISTKKLKKRSISSTLIIAFSICEK